MQYPVEVLMNISEQKLRVIAGKDAYVHRWMFSYDMQINFDYLCKFEKDMKALITEEGDVVAFNFRYNPEIVGNEARAQWMNSEAYEIFEIDFRLSLQSGRLVMFSLN
jgi:hypothetical protein